MKKETVVWQIIVTFLVLIMIITLNRYLQEHNKIDALSENAKCIADMRNAFPMEDRSSICNNILNYKLKKL